jgi:hypothetical protein
MDTAARGERRGELLKRHRRARLAYVAATLLGLVVLATRSTHAQGKANARPSSTDRTDPYELLDQIGQAV